MNSIALLVVLLPALCLAGDDTDGYSSKNNDGYDRKSSDGYNDNNYGSKSSDGYSDNGYGSKSSDGYSDNGYGSKSSDGYSDNGYGSKSSDGYSDNGYGSKSSDGYSDNGYGSKSSSGYSDNGYGSKSSSGYSDNGYDSKSSDGYGYNDYSSSSSDGYGYNDYSSSSSSSSDSSSGYNTDGYSKNKAKQQPCECGNYEDRGFKPGQGFYCGKKSYYYTVTNSQKFCHNPFTGKCQPFEFNGCGGNANNFETKEACEKHCVVKNYLIDTTKKCRICPRVPLVVCGIHPYGGCNDDCVCQHKHKCCRVRCRDYRTIGKRYAYQCLESVEVPCRTRTGA